MLAILEDIIWTCAVKCIGLFLFVCVYVLGGDQHKLAKISSDTDYFLSWKSSQT